MEYTNSTRIDSASFAGLIGLARKDITPSIGIYSRNWGASKTDIATGVHRPLTLTCMTVQEHTSALPLVLIAADLGWWRSAADERALRGAILEAFHLPESRLMFCLSHTHAGPVLFTEDRSRPGGDRIAPYLEQLKDDAIAAISEALAQAVPSTLAWHYGQCGLATNRDLPSEHENRVLVGFNPAIPADDTLLVGRITDEDEKITGILVNYACHPTTLAWDNPLLSPDYVGAMRTLVEEQTDATCLFFQGASGELAPAEQYVGDVAIADAHGYQLGHAVLATLAGMRKPGSVLVRGHVVESGAPLAIWQSVPKTPSATLRAEMLTVNMLLKELPSLQEIESQWHDSTDRVRKERLWRLRGIRKTVGAGSSSPMPLWIWRLGDACLVGQPNEAYSWFQQQVRQALAPTPVAVMNIVNGYAGYLPPHNRYHEDIYAVWSTPFASGALEQLAETTINALKKAMQ